MTQEINETITYVINDGVALITLDDGKANAVSSDFIIKLNRALDRAESDGAIVVIAGREGKFCAGLDLSVVHAGGEPAKKLREDAARLAYRILAFPAPVVMACTGHCLAAGALLLLAADYRIGADGPYKIGLNEVAIKIAMPHYGVEIAKARLTQPYLIPAVANSVMFTPKIAASAGFLDKVVDPDQVVMEAMLQAQQLKQIDLKAYHITKLRLRADLLKDVEGTIQKS